MASIKLYKYSVELCLPAQVVIDCKMREGVEDFGRLKLSDGLLKADQSDVSQWVERSEKGPTYSVSNPRLSSVHLEVTRVGQRMLVSAASELEAELLLLFSCHNI